VPIDKYFLSSSGGLCRQLVDALQQPATASGADEAPRTIDTSLQVGPITDLLEENREFFQGRMIQEGRTAEEMARAKELGSDLLDKISREGMRAYFEKSSVDTKLDLAPLMEAVNETMQGLRGNEFGPRHRQ